MQEGTKMTARGLKVAGLLLALLAPPPACVGSWSPQDEAVRWESKSVPDCNWFGGVTNRSSCTPQATAAPWSSTAMQSPPADRAPKRANESWPGSNAGRKRVRFCSVPDEDEGEEGRGGNASATGGRVRRYSLHGRKWDKTDLTWTLRTPSRHADRLPEGSIRQQLYAAMKVWEDASTIRFLEVHRDTPDVDIYVDFLEGDHKDGYTFDGPGGTLAHAFYPGRGIGGDMHFDDTEHFVPHSDVVRYESNSLLVTAAHELGHSLGLRHSDVGEALMAPFYQEYPEDFELPDDDKYGIQALYGRPQYPSTVSYRPPTTTTTTPRTRPTRPPVKPPTRPTRPPTRPTRPPTRPTRPPIRPTRPPTRPTRPPIKPPPTRPTRPPARPPTRPTTGPPVGPTQPPCSPPPPPPRGVPDTCATDFDAVTEYRGELLFFKGAFYWRVSRSGRLREGESPSRIRRRFPGLPAALERVDAVYSNRRDSLVFFSGPSFYELRWDLRLRREGRLADLGVDATRLDAAMAWGHNGRVYLFSGSRYWRLGWDGLAEADYPRDVAVWRGLPANYSSALTVRSATYFFAGRVYWSFDGTEMRLRGPPSLAAPFWFSCPFHRQRQHCSPASENGAASVVSSSSSWPFGTLPAWIAAFLRLYANAH